MRRKPPAGGGPDDVELLTKRDYHKDKSSCLITVFEILVQICFVKDSSANPILSYLFCDGNIRIAGCGHRKGLVKFINQYSTIIQFRISYQFRNSDVREGKEAVEPASRMKGVHGAPANW